MEKLCRILEAVVPPICVPRGAEEKLLGCKGLVCSYNRGGAGGCIRLWGKLGAGVRPAMEGVVQTRPRAGSWALLPGGSCPIAQIWKKSSSRWLGQAFLLGGTQRSGPPGGALGQLTGAECGDRASHVSGLLAAPRGLPAHFRGPSLWVWGARGLQAPDSFPWGGGAEAAPRSHP